MQYFVACVILVALLSKVKECNGDSSFVCVEEGRFADPEDCTFFFECFLDKKTDTFTFVSKSCLNGGFDQKLMKCIHFEKLENCTPGREPKNTVYIPHLDYLCSDSSVSFVCANCYSLVQCTGGNAYIELCGANAGLYCRSDKGAIFNGGVCYPEDFDACDCSRDSGSPSVYNKDHYRNNEFFVCPAEGVPSGHQKNYKCPANEVFDDTEKKCKTDATNFLCTKVGKFQNPDECNSFISCMGTSTGFLLSVIPCDDSSYYFNPSTEICENPCPWTFGGEFSCENNGRFPDPLDCQYYHLCIDIGATMLHAKKKCFTGHHFEVLDTGGGHCVNEESSSCRPQLKPYCDIEPTCPECETSSDCNFDGAAGPYCIDSACRYCPFFYTYHDTFGCLAKTADASTWEEARSSCINDLTEGGDLFVPNEVGELLPSVYDDSTFWIGVTSTGYDSFTRVRGSGSELPANSPYWANNPNFNDANECVFATNEPLELEASSCSAVWKGMCQYIVT